MHVICGAINVDFIKKYLKQMFCMMVSCICLISCGQTGVETATPVNVVNNTQNVQINRVATIPTAHLIAGEYILTNVQNKLDNPIKLQNIQIIANGSKISNSLITKYVDAHNCLQIEAKSSCSLKIFSK